MVLVREVPLHIVLERAGVALFTAALLIALTQCREQDEAPAPTEAPSVTAEEPEAAPAGDSVFPDADLLRLTVPASVAGGFPHGTHGDVECTQCHTALPAHGSHETVECTDCHRGPAWLGERVVFSRDECLSCHHGPEQTRSCLTCHGSAVARGRVMRTTTVDPTTGSGPTAAALPFSHGDHQALDCGGCHQEPRTHAFSLECRSCHEDHHDEVRNCSLCHQGPLLDAHDRSAHLGCGGAGCHEEPVTAGLMPTRTVCLTCHTEQSEHYPDGSCGECHRISLSGRMGVSP